MYSKTSSPWINYLGLRARQRRCHSHESLHRLRFGLFPLFSVFYRLKCLNKTLSLATLPFISTIPEHVTVGKPCWVRGSQPDSGSGLWRQCLLAVFGSLWWDWSVEIIKTYWGFSKCSALTSSSAINLLPWNLRRKRGKTIWGLQFRESYFPLFISAFNKILCCPFHLCSTRLALLWASTYGGSLTSHPTVP